MSEERIAPGAITEIYNIPVTVNFDQSKLVGYADVHRDGTASIKLTNKELVRALTDQTLVDNLSSVSIGIEFKPAPEVADPIAEFQARLF